MNMFQKILSRILNTKILYWLIPFVCGFFGFIFFEFLTTKESYLNNVSIQLLYVAIIPLVLTTLNKMGSILITEGIPVRIKNRLKSMFNPWRIELYVYMILILIGGGLYYSSLQYQEDSLLRMITGIWIGFIIGYSSKTFRIFYLLYSYERDLNEDHEKKLKQDDFNRKFKK